MRNQTISSVSSVPTAKLSCFKKQCVKAAQLLIEERCESQRATDELHLKQLFEQSFCLDSRQHPLYKIRPFIPMDEIAVHQALNTDSVCQRILGKKIQPVAGQLVGVRLNLNVLKNTGIAMQTLHKAPQHDKRHQNKGFFNGEALHYQHTVQLHNAYFNVDQQARELIASGEKAKSAMASIDGEYDLSLPTHLNGIEVSFNPIKTHLFIDSEGYAVRFAEHVIICGHRAYLSGHVEWHSLDTAPQRMSITAPSIARFKGPSLDLSSIVTPVPVA